VPPGMIRALCAAVLLAACGAPAGAYGQTPGVTPVPPYSRAAFGTSWATVRGHCDTREIVLERDAGPAAVDTDGDGCRDDAPILDLYTARLVDPAHADADHVYPLRGAWDGGAWKWTPAQRRTFANDITNLRAVGASINRSKGDLSPSRWKPPAKSGWCEYSRIYTGTAQKWHLPVSDADGTALRDMQTTCDEAAK